MCIFLKTSGHLLLLQNIISGDKEPKNELQEAKLKRHIIDFDPGYQGLNYRLPKASYETVRHISEGQCLLSTAMVWSLHLSILLFTLPPLKSGRAELSLGRGSCR